MRYTLFSVSLLLFACGGATPKAENPATAQSSGGDNANVQTFDINDDGTADSWQYFRTVDGKRVLARKEFDVNFDAKVDIWRFYSADGAIERDQMDMDFDGKVDVTTIYEDSKVIRKEVDLEFDERPDIFKF